MEWNWMDGNTVNLVDRSLLVFYFSFSIFFILAPTEIRTQVSGFKVLSDNHYTIRANTKEQKTKYFIDSFC